MRPTVGALTGWPTASSRSRRLRRLLRTQIWPVIGSPAVSGSTSSCKLATMVKSFFFRPWSAATRQPNSIDRAVLQRGSQLPAPPSNRLFIDARDFKQDSVGAVPKPLRFHRQIPAPLLLIQPTQQQIHVSVVLTARMGFTPPARA